MNCCAYFHHFLTNLHLIQYARSPHNATNMEFCPIWVKFCKRDLYVMTMTICLFHENHHREGWTSCMGVN